MYVNCGDLDGGSQCPVSILRNGYAEYSCHLYDFIHMTHVDVKKLPYPLCYLFRALLHVNSHDIEVLCRI